MQTKLTLRLEDELIVEAKQYAHKEGKSLSQIVADYFVVLSSSETSKLKQAQHQTIQPMTAQLLGCITDSTLAEEDYREHLVKKHR